MGNRNSRSPFSCLVESGLYNLLAANVDSASGFVKYENGWLFDDGSGDSDALALTAG